MSDGSSDVCSSDLLSRARSSGRQSRPAGADPARPAGRPDAGISWPERPRQEGLSGRHAGPAICHRARDRGDPARQLLRQCRPGIYALCGRGGTPFPPGAPGGQDKEIHFTPEGKRAILAKVIHAEQYEKFLGKKYVGTKRFGLDGGEAMIPALESVIKYGAHYGFLELVYGMAPRGLLTVLATVLAKAFRVLFHDFSVLPPPPAH